jgi:hypothetical protein
MKHVTAYHWALMSISAIILALVWWGIAWLDVPPIYRLARLNNPILLYQGHILIMLAVVLAWFHRWAANKLLWLAREIHRWVSALMLMAAIVIDSSMHLLSIPHMEGWWLPLLGGSAFMTGITAWFYQWRKKPADTEATK